jgi:hypothetical protein
MSEWSSRRERTDVCAVAEVALVAIGVPERWARRKYQSRKAFTDL